MSVFRPFCIYCGGPLPLVDPSVRSTKEEWPLGHAVGFCTEQESGVLTRRSAADRFRALDVFEERGRLPYMFTWWEDATAAEGVRFAEVPRGTPEDSPSWDETARAAGIELGYGVTIAEGRWSLEVEAQLYWPGARGVLHHGGELDG